MLGYLKIIYKILAFLRNNKKNPFAHLLYLKLKKSLKELGKIITVILLVANFANIKVCKNQKKIIETLYMGTHPRVLNESYPMNTNSTGFRWF